MDQIERQIRHSDNKEILIRRYRQSLSKRKIDSNCPLQSLKNEIFQTNLKMTTFNNQNLINKKIWQFNETLETTIGNFKHFFASSILMSNYQKFPQISVLNFLKGIFS